MNNETIQLVAVVAILIYVWRGSYIECLLNGESQILTVTVDAPEVRCMNIVTSRVSRIKGDNVSFN